MYWSVMGEDIVGARLEWVKGGGRAAGGEGGRRMWMVTSVDSAAAEA